MVDDTLKAELGDCDEFTEPVVAYKICTISRRDTGAFGFVPLSSMETYDAVATARCLKNPHPAPVAGCRCGFWAMFDADDLPAAVALVQGRSYVLLEVELWGRSEIHELGIRAQHQSVLSVTLPQFCAKCGNKANEAYVGKDGRVVVLCSRHRRGTGLLAADLTGELGTEVRLGEVPWTYADQKAEQLHKFRAVEPGLKWTYRVVLAWMLAVTALVSYATWQGGSAALAKTQPYAHGVRATGRVVDPAVATSHANLPGDWNFNVRFVTDSGKVAVVPAALAATKRPKVGDRVEVSYLPDAPQSAHVLPTKGSYNPDYADLNVGRGGSNAERVAGTMLFLGVGYFMSLFVASVFSVFLYYLVIKPLMKGVRRKR